MGKDLDTLGIELVPGFTTQGDDDLGQKFKTQGEGSATMGTPQTQVEQANPYDLIADRYAGLSTGTWIEWSFETQSSQPVDGAAGNGARKYSPFILRLVPPLALIPNQHNPSNYDVNLLGYATAGASYVTGSGPTQSSGASLLSSPFSSNTNTADLTALEQTVAAGQVVSSVVGNTTNQISTLVDIYTLADIFAQMTNMVNAPLLGLLVNPNELSISYNSIQEYTNRSREGYIFQRWGEEQPTLSIKGSTGSFLAGHPPGTFPPKGGGDSLAGYLGGALDQERWSAEQPTTVSGVQYASRRESAAWQNFQSLYLFYRNNGYLYDNVKGTCAHLGVGAVAIDYDQKTYIGHIDSFNYSFQETMPHRIEWSMEFTVDMEYDHAVAPAYVGPMRTPSPELSAAHMREATNSSVVLRANAANSGGRGKPVERADADNIGGVGDTYTYDRGPNFIRDTGRLAIRDDPNHPADERGITFDSGGESPPITTVTKGHIPFELVGLPPDEGA